MGDISSLSARASVSLGAFKILRFINTDSYS